MGREGSQDDAMDAPSRQRTTAWLLITSSQAGSCRQSPCGSQSARMTLECPSMMFSAIRRSHNRESSPWEECT